MSDNVTVVAGAYDATVATDDVAGIQYQRVKLALGADGAYDVDVDSGQQTMANSLPVVIASNQSALTVSSHAVTNAGVFVVQENGSALTSLQLIDDVVHSGDAALSKYAVMGAVLDDVATGTVTENQANALRMSSRRALLVEGVASGTAQAVTEGSAASILTSVQLIDDVVHSGDAALSKYAVIGAVLDDAATGTVTENQANALRMSSRRALLVEGVASGTAIQVGDNSASLSVDWNGTQPVTGSGNATGALRVELPTNGTGVIATVSTVTAVTTVTTVTNLTGGTTAHDGAGSAVNPLAIGGYASAAAPTDVSNDTDIVRAWRLRNGAAATVITAAGALIGGDAANGLDVDVTRLPAKKITYAASSAITVTNLHSIASSSTWVAGWESGAVDNSSNLYIDYIINAKIVVAAAGLSAGEIRMYLVAEMDDSTWPDVFDGTESTETITDTEMRDSICKLAASSATDTTASDSYWLMCPSAATVFGGTIPRKFVIFITQSTGANLAASGSAVYTKGVYLT